MAWTSQVRDFGKEAWVELTKVSWPSRNELIDSTVVVIGTVIIITVFVYVGRQSKSSCHPTNLPNIAAKIVLSRALGNRGVADGASGEVLGVASSR